MYESLRLPSQDGQRRALLRESIMAGAASARVRRTDRAVGERPPYSVRAGPRRGPEARGDRRLPRSLIQEVPLMKSLGSTFRTMRWAGLAAVVAAALAVAGPARADLTPTLISTTASGGMYV